MIRIILSIILLINISYANSERYFIKLGSFKNLNGLKQNINRIPNYLRSHIIIVKKGAWYVPFAYYTPRRESLYRYVPKFRRYFHEAFISKSKYMLNYPIVKNYNKKHIIKRARYIAPTVKQRREPNYNYISPSLPKVDKFVETISIPTYIKKKDTLVVSTKKSREYNFFTKNMLSGKHFYLAYKASTNSPNLLIKVTFGNHTVTYQPIVGDMTMTKANYLIDNKKLYMFSDSFTENGAYSKLEKNRKDYFLVSSWADGKKINTLRYYFKLNEAKEYLGIEKSNGLANALEEGKFDDFFLDEDY